ncbi:MAG TPA: helix-turn-helix transcriptional regulator [Terriglobales bacterium]|nr:helix-turn-helix transcriptional regulator [Terriglobales bacterium]
MLVAILTSLTSSRGRILRGKEMNVVGATHVFSQREQQIVNGLFQAKSVKDIAADLQLSVNTVKDYIKTIYRKSSVHSARELMVKMGPPATPLPPVSVGTMELSQLLQAAMALEGRTGPDETLTQLTQSILRCSRAQRVSYWRLVRNGADQHLISEQSMSTLRIGKFLHRVLERGHARMEEHERESSEARQMASVGVVGEVIGVMCAPTHRVSLLLASDPAQGGFCQFDLPTLRLLARLAQSSVQKTLHSMEASA